MLVTIGSHSVT